MKALAEKRKDRNGYCREAFDDLAQYAVNTPYHRGEEYESTRTKIQDHPSSPSVPDMNEMPYAIRPEKAPEQVAPPQKSPNRHCSMCFGYHSDSL